MRLRVLPLSVLSLFALAGACSSSSSGGGADVSDGGGGTDAPSGVPGADGGTQTDSGTVMGTAPMVSLTAPMTASVSDNNVATVAITRAGDLAEAVTLTVTGLPTGVTATDLTIAAGSTMQNITLHATMTAPVTDAPVKVTVSGATASKLMATTTFDLSVRGLPGTLDTTFGGGGIAPGIGAIGTQATGVGVQKNGAIVLGGYDGGNYIVARYSLSGALDTTFGTMGYTKVAPASGAGIYATGGVLLDAQDRILLTGAASDTSASQLGHLLRFTAAGALDNTFATMGNATVGTKAMGLTSMVGMISSNTDVVVGGVNRLAKFDNTGTAVGGFTSPGAFNITPYSLAAESSGKVVAAGLGATFTRFDPATGAIDTTFGTGGFFTLSTSNTVNATVIGPNDTIYACGEYDGAHKAWLLFALDKNAGPAAFTFSAVVGDQTQDSVCSGIALQPDGKVVAVGTVVSGGRTVMAIVRTTNMGALDPTFGTGGILYVPVGGATSAANAVALTADGKILVAGHGDMDFAVVRMWQ